MTLDDDLSVALGFGADLWSVQTWAESVRAARIKYAREVEANRQRRARDPVYRERIRASKRECERRRRARRAAVSGAA